MYLKWLEWLKSCGNAVDCVGDGGGHYEFIFKMLMTSDLNVKLKVSS
jgi:hypothetical protein